MKRHPIEHSAKAASHGIEEPALRQCDEPGFTGDCGFGDDREGFRRTRVDTDIDANRSNGRSVSDPKSWRDSRLALWKLRIGPLRDIRTIHKGRPDEVFPEEGKADLDTRLHDNVTAEGAWLEVTVAERSGIGIAVHYGDTRVTPGLAGIAAQY